MKKFSSFQHVKLTLTVHVTRVIFAAAIRDYVTPQKWHVSTTTNRWTDFLWCAQWVPNPSQNATVPTLLSFLLKSALLLPKSYRFCTKTLWAGLMNIIRGSRDSCFLSWLFVCYLTISCDVCFWTKINYNTRDTRKLCVFYVCTTNKRLYYKQKVATFNEKNWPKARPYITMYVNTVFCTAFFCKCFFFLQLFVSKRHL